jgi:ATP adenylyltransferase
MTYTQLLDFLDHKMRMNQIYQPLLVKLLVDAGGAASFRHLAQEFARNDEGQVSYYERRIKEMPFRVLESHKVVSRAGEMVALTIPRLTMEQRAVIKRVCEKHIQRFVEERGATVFFLGAVPVPDSLRYQLLKESGGRCALCGATKKERPLDIDHIIPKARWKAPMGDPNARSNLQVLCSK